MFGAQHFTTLWVKNSEENNLLAFETWCQRRIIKISRVDRIINKEIFRRLRENRGFLNALKIRRAKLNGHTLQHNNLLERIIKESKEGRTIEEDHLSNTLTKQLKLQSAKYRYYEFKKKSGVIREEWKNAANQSLNCERKRKS